jgi:type II secretory pathway pseudopilin PulG
VRAERSAFTLVELVITCLICAIIAAVAGPKYLNAYHRYRVNAAAQRIKSDLDYARQQAVTLSQTHTVRFVPASETYSLVGVVGLDRSGYTYTIDLAGPPYEVNLSTASFGGSADLAYDFYGIPASGGIVTVQSGAYSQTVTVNADTGKASVP